MFKNTWNQNQDKNIIYFLARLYNIIVLSSKSFSHIHAPLTDPQEPPKIHETNKKKTKQIHNHAKLPRCRKRGRERDAQGEELGVADEARPPERRVQLTTPAPAAPGSTATRTSPPPRRRRRSAAGRRPSTAAPTSLHLQNNLEPSLHPRRALSSAS